MNGYLFGQHRLQEEGVGEKLVGLGLIVVEGPNDVIALDVLGVQAVGLCSNTVTGEQVEKISQLARAFGGGVVTLMLDCDVEGENGARLALVEVAQHCPVRLAWSAAAHGGAFKGRQPESLKAEEWEQIHIALAGASQRALPKCR